MGVQVVASVKPDVRTRLFPSPTSVGINVAVSKALPYGPVRECALATIGRPHVVIQFEC